MPLNTGVDTLGDGFRINGRVQRVLASGDIPAAVRNRTLAEVEAWINDWLATNYTAETGEFAIVHVVSVSPLKVIGPIVSREPITDPLWWDITRGGQWRL